MTQEARTRGADLWLPLRQPDPQRLTLFCLPFAGAGANVYLPWLDAFGTSIQPCPVEYPGRARRFAERLPGDLGMLAETALDGLRFGFSGRFAFFGHSMGALLAYEMTRRLAEQSGPLPEALVIACWQAPHLRTHWPKKHTLADDAFVAELRRMGGTPPEVLANAKLLAHVLPITRGDFRLTEEWIPPTAPPLPLPIHVIGGDNDLQIPVESLSAWAKHTTVEATIDLLPGGHFCLFDHRERAARLIVERLGHRHPA
jgi:medium-chain acyl-[acyl-carrier-protein] hydrolase